MSATLLEEVGRYLDGLDATQSELARLFERKRAALRDGDAPALHAIANEETEAVDRLRAAVGQRRRILARARDEGSAAESMTALASRFHGETVTDLPRRIAVARSAGEAIRRESWVHWIVAQRACGHYAHLLDLVAHRGRTAATYDSEPARESAGGAVLDASA